jgi:Tol biopolymer transport system component
MYRLSDGRRARPGLPGIGALAFVDGRLIYSRADGTLMAVALDAAAMELTSPPVELRPRVGSNGAIGTSVGMSESGTLVYRTSSALSSARLELVDLEGRVTSVAGDFATFSPPRFSPDGRRVAVVRDDIDRGGSSTRTGDLWVTDMISGVAVRLTSDGSASGPSWFPDGRRLAYTNGGGSALELRTVPVDGSAPSTRLADVEGAQSAVLAADGRSIFVVARGVDIELLRVWLDGTSRVDTLLAGSNSGAGVIPSNLRPSPDGRWLAFVDWQTSQVWVRSLESGGLLQVSTSGTNRGPAVWGPESRHLYYVASEGLVDIELETNPTLNVVRRTTVSGPLAGASLYDISPDGRSFVVAHTDRRADDVLVAVNWLAEASQAWGS